MNGACLEAVGPDGQRSQGTLQIEKRPSRCCSAVPATGANHYYIHVNGGLAHPGRALASAERLRGMMPARDIWSTCPLTHAARRRYEDAAEATGRGVAVR